MAFWGVEVPLFGGTRGQRSVQGALCGLLQAGELHMEGREFSSGITPSVHLPLLLQLLRYSAGLVSHLVIDFERYLAV